MYEQTKAGGEEQAFALLSAELEKNRSQSHSAWLVLKVLVCPFAFVMLALSLGLCVVYHCQYGEYKVLSTRSEEHFVDQWGGSNGLATVKLGAAADAEKVETFSSQRHISVRKLAVLKGHPRRKSHLRSRAKMSSFLGIVEDLLHEDLLKLHHKILCLDPHADIEVVALRARGFQDARGINLPPAPLNSKHRHETLQINKLADMKLDFFFTSMFDYTHYPALFVQKIEKALKVGGFAAMHVSLNKWRDKYITGEPGCGIKPVTLLFQHSEIVYVSSVAAPGLDTIIVFKKSLQSMAIQDDKKEMKKKQLHDNPSLPQSVIKPVELSLDHKYKNNAAERQLKSTIHAPKIHGTAGSLPHLFARGTVLRSETPSSGNIVMKKSTPMGIAGAVNPVTFFIVQGLRDIAQLSRALLQDSFPASKKHT